MKKKREKKISREKKIENILKEKKRERN